MYITGKDLRTMRHKANISSRKVADVVGVTRKTVENWEANIGQPKLNQFLALCVLYQLNSAKLVAQLMQRNDPEQSLELDELMLENTGSH